MYMKGIIIYIILLIFNPFYTQGHYLNGIRNITFLLHPGCHNNSSESILTTYPDIDVENCIQVE